MTENKRFEYNVNKNSIEYDGKHFAYCNGQQGKITNKLNELNDKNKFLSAFRGFITMEHQKIKEENEQLKQQIEELEFKLRTIEAYDRTVKEEHSDTVYDFKKKLEKW